MEVEETDEHERLDSIVTTKAVVPGLGLPPVALRVPRQPVADREIPTVPAHRFGHSGLADESGEVTAVAVSATLRRVHRGPLLGADALDLGEKFDLKELLDFVSRGVRHGGRLNNPQRHLNLRPSGDVSPVKRAALRASGGLGAP